MEDPILRRRDRTPTITVRGYRRQSSAAGFPVAIMKQLQPIVDSLPPDTASTWRVRLRIGQSHAGDDPLFPIMIALTLLIIILQVRSISAMVMVF
jgi:multidrug efflux pump subunit AcrB